MIEDLEGHLTPIDFNHTSQHLPELKKLNAELTAISFQTPIDSTNMQPHIWDELAQIIEAHYHKVDGFVVLHGSDTMSYTASALSFMLEGLAKPVIFTGSQLPIGVLRTDGKENIITAIEIAASKDVDEPLIQEVCIYFEYQLYRANRTHKFNAEHFQAFHSPNYPVLANAGVHITYDFEHLLRIKPQDLVVRKNLCTDVAILTIYPGISKEVLQSYVQIENLKGLVIQSFGAGNLPNTSEITTLIKTLSEKGVLLLNITQCNIGSVDPEKYATNPSALKYNIVHGKDMTLEAAITKMMYLLSLDLSAADQKKYLATSLRGELSV